MQAAGAIRFKQGGKIEHPHLASALAQHFDGDPVGVGGKAEPLGLKIARQGEAVQHAVGAILDQGLAAPPCCTITAR